MTSPVRFQIAVDAADPHRLADFWAAALGWAVEDHEPAVRAALEAGYADDTDVVTHNGRLAWSVAAAAVLPGSTREDSGRRLLFQTVTEAKAGKNRLHLDLNVGRDRLDAETERLTALGATVLYRVDEPAGFHVTLQDPEGNEFCVQ
ncbi:VOC family protein [Streptacidiphilus melanogenes]|uniref:VOC family protein n=1 Tax=Streptacidiphilus melanogenes TaxID=411235 RepID=UPI0005A9B189|nr:VOC family protein [Streptacidiphilus melanogenes]